MRGKTAGPLFIWKSGLFLTRENFVAEVRRALEAAGLEASDFNGHSFRIGAATTAASRGMEDSMIKDVRSLGERCLPTICKNSKARVGVLH